MTVADTLVDLLTRPLDAPGAARRVRDLLTVHLDPLSGWARLPDGELLPPPATRALLARHDQGRNARQASPALKALLATVDGQRCRYPGCTRRRRMHAHHVTHWTDGGPTDLANLILLCSRHHRHVHDSGTRLALHPDRRLDISTADGQPIPHRPAPPWRPATELDPHVRPDTLPPTVIDSRLDLHYAVAVLMQQAA